MPPCIFEVILVRQMALRCEPVHKSRRFRNGRDLVCLCDESSRTDDL